MYQFALRLAMAFCKTVRSASEAGAPTGGPLDPDFVARDLREAAIWVLQREGVPLPDRPGAPLSRAPRPAGAGA